MGLLALPVAGADEDDKGRVYRSVEAILDPVGDAAVIGGFCVYDEGTGSARRVQDGGMGLITSADAPVLASNHKQKRTPLFKVLRDKRRDLETYAFEALDEPRLSMVRGDTGKARFRTRARNKTNGKTADISWTLHIRWSNDRMRITDKYTG